MQRVEFNRVELISRLFCEFPNGKGVEVGTFKGHYSKDILKDWDGTLYMVDVWNPLDEEYNDASNHGNYTNGVYSDAIESIKGFEERAIMVRSNSQVASSMFEDGSLDFVYIDANHAYDYVKQDIDLWYPKVKEGGYLLGHDYLDLEWDQTEKDKHIYVEDGKYLGVFGVNPAVNEFCEREGYDLMCTSEWFGTWYIKKDTSLKPKDICVLSLYDDNYSEMAEVTVFDNLKKYCDLHGYTFWPHKIERIENDRVAQWQKIIVSLDILTNNNFKWLFFIDTDCLILNQQIKLESFIDDNASFVVPALNFEMDTPVRNSQGTDAVITSQYLVKGDQTGIAILKDIWEAKEWPTCYDINYHDYEGRQARITLGKPQFVDRVKILPWRDLNCFWYINDPDYFVAYRNINDYCWRPGDFIVHVTGYEKEKRINLLKSLNRFTGGMLVFWSFEAETGKANFTSLEDYEEITVILYDLTGNAMINYKLHKIVYKRIYSLYMDPELLKSEFIIKAFDQTGKQICLYLKRKSI